MLTLEERERRAYITGDLQLAAVLGEAIDAESERIENLKWENEHLRDRVNELESEPQV